MFGFLHLIISESYVLLIYLSYAILSDGVAFLILQIDP